MSGSITDITRLVGSRERAGAGFTVLGASGYIGGHMVRYLRSAGHAVYAPRRGVAGLFDSPLGHVIYAVGLTADFRERPLDTIDAHVGVLAEMLRCARYDSLTYLSSTRVYSGLTAGNEQGALVVNPNDPSDLYNLSKLTGEALCLAQPDPRVRVARLSNVFGRDMDDAARPSQNFLAALIREAGEHSTVTLRTAAASSRDFVAIEDVVRALHRIALDGQERIYNVASGRNTSNGDIAAALAGLTGARFETASGAPVVTYPPLDTRRLAALFPAGQPWRPALLLDCLPDLVNASRPAPAAISGGTA